MEEKEQAGQGQKIGNLEYHEKSRGGQINAFIGRCKKDIKYNNGNKPG